MPDLSHIVIDDLEARSADELTASYRAICALVLYRTALATTKPPQQRRQEIDQKVVARQWLAGDRGIITFPEACRALGYDPGVALRRLNACANPDKTAAISMGVRRPRRHYVFGRRKTDGRAIDIPGKQNPAAG